MLGPNFSKTVLLVGCFSVVAAVRLPHAVVQRSLRKFEIYFSCAMAQAIKSEPDEAVKIDPDEYKEDLRLEFLNLPDEL